MNVCSNCRELSEYLMVVVRPAAKNERFVLRYCTKPACSDRCAQVTGQLYAY